MHAEIDLVYNWAHLIPLGLGFRWMGAKGIHSWWVFYPCEDQKAPDISKGAAYICWDAPSGPPLSLEIALCVHADQFIFFPGGDLTCHLFTEDTSRANLQHLQQRIHSLKEIYAEYIYAYYRTNVLCWEGKEQFLSPFALMHNTQGHPPPPHSLLLLGGEHAELFTLLHYLYFQIVLGINWYWSPDLISIVFSNSLI